jgi:hypothetical protein
MDPRQPTVGRVWRGADELASIRSQVVTRSLTVGDLHDDDAILLGRGPLLVGRRARLTRQDLTRRERTTCQVGQTCAPDAPARQTCSAATTCCGLLHWTRTQLPSVRRSMRTPAPIVWA